MAKGSRSKNLTCKACKVKFPREIVIENGGFCDDCMAHTKLCDCGCGEEMPRYTKKGKVASYINQAHRNKVMNDQMRQRTLDDPDYASTISETRSNAAKKMYDDRPELRQQRSEEGKKRFEDPEEREKISKQAREYWSDPEHREEQRQRQLDFIEDNPEITELRTEVSREYWSDEEAREKKSEQQESWWKEDHDRREDMSERLLGNEYGSGNKGKPKSEEWKLSVSGENNYNWKGGISFEPYDEDFDEEFKEFIRTRQNYRCADEDTTCKDINRALDVHHIDGNKKNSVPENCIALCCSHHGRTNIELATQTRYKAFVENL